MKSPEVISIGNLLVEIMRTTPDQPLDRPGLFAGPYPSGDTAIYIDSVARLGHSTGYIGAVGDDDFGRIFLERFAADGVDFSCGRVLPGYTTGVAFIAYAGDGSRRYVFHWRHAAAGQLSPDIIEPAYFRDTRWLHLTGCNLAVNDGCRDACLAAMHALPVGAQVSFDPNIRREVLSVEAIRSLVAPVLARAALIVPSLGEAAMLAGAANDEEGCRRWAAEGKLVALKLGAQGCRVFQGQRDLYVPGYLVDEVDPTGAGDSFSAGLSVALLEGMPLDAACRFANAAGALAVTRLGLMEGAPWRAEVEDLMRRGA